MAEQNKILTVSYGTFSCTLEGFEDSFGTMKAIAEYFRDLAADDRYFGAEPPTPDPDMLSRIAEREIARRVEARTSEDGIVLRAAEALAAPVAETVTEAPTAPVQEATGAVDVEEAEAEAPPPDVAAEVSQDDAPTSQDASQVAEPSEAVASEDAVDQPIEAATTSEPLATEDTEKPSGEPVEAPDEDVTSETQPEAADASQPVEVEATERAGLAAPAQPDIAEDNTDADIADVAENDAPAGDDTGSEAPLAADEATEMLAATDPDDFAVDSALDDSADDVEAEASDETVAEVTDPAPDSVAAKLQRIRAVVGRGSDFGGASDDVAEAMAEDIEEATGGADVTPDEAISGAPLDLGALGKVISDTDDDAVEDVAEVPTAEEHPEAEEAASDLQPVQARVVRLARESAESDEAHSADDVPSLAAADGEGPGSFGGLAALDGAEEYEDTLGDSGTDLADDLDDDLLEELAMVAEDAGEPVEESASDPAQEAEDRSVEAVTEVMDDPDAGDDAVDAEIEDWKAITQDGSQGADEVIYDAASASENAFADLDGETAEDEDADAAASVDASDEVEDATEEADVRTARNRLPEAVDADAAVARLMSEADAKMNEPEGRGRREAIAHLKAAVAAKEAARQLGEDDDAAGGDENAFREDLDEVVRPNAPSRPTRPVGERSRTERPRPAPLKLVASQRIDAPAEEAPAMQATGVAPVRPRRVSREAPGLQQADGGFATWAEQRGAFSLTDLVEAAAAHTLSVDGVEAFSRPQVMRKVRGARTEEEANREDELRAFGTLLRQGRFTKVRAGRFHLAEDSRFLDRPQAAQG